VSFIVGIVFWGGFNTAIELTNTEAFCISCHEMRENVFREYKKTIHYSNRTGVRAICSDCHVPKQWEHKVTRKISATNELFHHLLGSIDTRKKFTERRITLARIVWKTMKETDSRECRNCHGEAFMDLRQQHSVAAERHRTAEAEGKTCIDCHKGIAHSLPEEFLEEEHLRFERENVACSDCHTDMATAPAGDGW